MLEPVTQIRSAEPTGTLTRRAGATPGAAEHLPDLLLIERARAGDGRAVEALIRRYGRRLFRVARSVLSDDDAAELVVQEAYLAAFADLSRTAPSGKFAAWLTRLAFSQARSLRASARSAPPAPRSPAVTPGELDAAQERLELEAAIAGLPEVFRAVYVLRVVEGISGIETAASLGVHETTVRTRMYRAQRRLPPELGQRLRASAVVLELSAGRLERIVQRVLAQLPHTSMLTMSASPP